LPADPARHNALCPGLITMAASYLTEKSKGIQLPPTDRGASLEFAEEGGAACVTRTRDPIITKIRLWNLVKSK
jgi:hypothetical protein